MKERSKTLNAARGCISTKNPSKTASVFRLGKCLFLLKKEREALVELFRAKDMNAASGGLSSEDLAELEQMIQKIT